MLFHLLPLALALLRSARADVTTGVPDAAPPGYEEWTSPIVLPAKPVAGDGGWAPYVARARAFVAQLTLEEKVNVTTGVDTDGRCVGNTGTIPRLGWGGLCLEDSPLGVRDTDYASAFPAAINVATTWDKDLIYQRGLAMGQEHKAKGVNVALGPMTNLGRVAAGGRNWEGFGADPFLAGVATAATVDGMQDAGVMACVKHLIGNEQEHFRGGSEAPQVYSSDIDDRTMHELYLWPFAEAVRAGVASVMCSYNKVNQTQTCQNSKLVNGLVKEELDFQGFLLSDWAALINGVQPALAGTDMNMPGFVQYGNANSPDPATANNSWWGANLVASVRNGSVPEARVDDMVTRTLAAWYKLGQDKAYPAVNFDYNTENTVYEGQVVNLHVDVQGSHYELIRAIGSASTVLLKNTNGSLPLALSSIRRIAIFGSDAGPNPDGPNGCGDRGCDQGTLAMGWGSGTANFPYLIDPYSAIQSYVHAQKPNVVIEAVLSDFNYGQVASVSAQADTCLVFANADSGEGYITVDTNAGDRNNLTLWHSGDTLIATAASVCANTIVVLHTVGPVLVEAWIDHPNVTAVLYAGLPGQESGNAIADVLFGAVNPSGRLPYTIAKQRADYPADVVYASTETTPQIVYEEALDIDYRHFDAANITPRFEFGFGLSYTTFSYHNLNIRHSAARRSGLRRATSSSSSSTTSSSTSSSVPSASSVSSASSSASTTPEPSSSAPSSGATSVSSSGLSSSASSTLNATSTASLSAAPAFSAPAQTSPGGPAALFATAYTVSYSVTNAGGADGHEVSQLYVRFPPAAGEPPRVLRGFDRSLVKRGQTVQVSLELRVKDISVWDVVKQQWVVPSGTFTVEIGSSSRKTQLTGTFSR